MPIQNKENATSHIHQMHNQQQQHHKTMRSKCREQFFNMIDNTCHEDPQLKLEDFTIPSNGLHIVSEKTKLFESGRPLSPDGVDRTLLYKSELSRLNQKVAVPNVAHRKKEFEQITDNSDYRLSTDTETVVSESGPASESVVQQVVRREPKHSHLTTDSLNEDERRMRRISYLRATANDNNMEVNNNAGSPSGGGGVRKGDENLAAEFAENDRTVNLNVINDNRDRRRHGRLEPSDDGDLDGEDIGLLLKNKDKKRMSNVSMLALHEGPLQIKITLIDGKRSHDRSWKNVWAELKGFKLILVVQREGKPNQVGQLFRITVEFQYNDPPL